MQTFLKCVGCRVPSLDDVLKIYVCIGVGQSNAKDMMSL